MFWVSKKRGFTLIELLVVISIISLLTSIVLAMLSTARAKARDAKLIQGMHQLQVALELFRNENGYYPGEDVYPDPTVYPFGYFDYINYLDSSNNLQNESRTLNNDPNSISNPPIFELNLPLRHLR